MTRNQITYAGIAVVFILSMFVVLSTRGISEIISEFAGIPLVGSLVYALFLMMRDQASHERALLALDRQNNFVLGASSHMANVAFDKYVEFCEEYVHEAQEALSTLFRYGPCEDMLTHAGKLYRIQQKHALWITAKIEQDIEPFQTEPQKIGADASYVSSKADKLSQEQRDRYINQMYTALAKVTGMKEWEGEKLTDELAVSSQIRLLRSILGTEELNEIRHFLVAKAVNELRV